MYKYFSLNHHIFILYLKNKWCIIFLAAENTWDLTTIIDWSLCKLYVTLKQAKYIFIFCRKTNGLLCEDNTKSTWMGAAFQIKISG